ncbi:hypothetical protein GALL_118370 [mine drainage metagenome]|uniref:Uncharacterized protein n=1 Tax=mine drainage metagenome TaxID=410659 RepID=A0A1J5SPT6_9ZZZZ
MRQKHDRYELLDQGNGEIVIRDKSKQSADVKPSCGLFARDYYNFLKDSPKHGNAQAQKFLSDIAEGKRPITDMQDLIQKHRFVLSTPTRWRPA